MIKKIKLTGRLVFVLSGIVFCMSLLCGCNRGTDEKEEQGSKDSISTEDFDRYDLELAYNAYEKDYSTELEIGDEKIPLEIWRSNVGNRVIKIDGQEVPIESRGLPLGGAGLETKGYDFTGDGKEEIVLVESSGTSGGVQYILVFANTDGEWDEVDIPSDIYDVFPEFVQEKLKESDIEIDSSLYNYFTVSFNEEKIIIDYCLFADSDSEPIDMGKVREELIYSSDEKRFVLGDTLYIPAEN